MPTKLEKSCTLVDLIDTLDIQYLVKAKPNKTLSVPVFCTTFNDQAGAALIFVNFKKGSFQSLTIIPYSTEAELKLDFNNQARLAEKPA